jgi:hypothetical protein
MEQHKLFEGPLLNKDGNLNEAGYAFSLVKKYSRKDIKARKSRIKEWDYYYIGDDKFGIALTIDDNSYMGLVSASILDFEKKTYINKAKMFWFPFGKVKLPESSNDGDVIKEGKGYYFSFENNKGKRHLEIFLKDMTGGKDLYVDAILKPSSNNSMVIATPFKKDKHFYYNQKINNLIASGKFKYGDFEYTFKNGTLGVLDWGRGVWTYKNTWYWSSLNVTQDGHKIGWNLGYGFGDTSHASENMLFVDNKVYKLNDVEFCIPKMKSKDDFLSPWKIISKDGTINVKFYPILDRHDKTNALIIGQDAHQVFGKFDGIIKTIDGDIKIKDALGFAEKVSNRW